MWPISTPHQSSNDESIVFKFCEGDYITRDTNPYKFGLDHAKGDSFWWWWNTKVLLLLFILYFLLSLDRALSKPLNRFYIVVLCRWSCGNTLTVSCKFLAWYYTIRYYIYVWPSKRYSMYCTAPCNTLQVSCLIYPWDLQCVQGVVQ
jgi:hypothetical protein